MDEETYVQILVTLQFREIRYNIVAPGRRTPSIDVITMFADNYPSCQGCRFLIVREFAFTGFAAITVDSKR